MTQDECIKQAINRIKHVKHVDRTRELETWTQFAKEALEPLTKRDVTVVDGKATAEKYDRSTFSSSTVEVQLHAPRQVQPYKYGPADVLWLEREIRRRAGL